MTKLRSPPLPLQRIHSDEFDVDGILPALLQVLFYPLSVGKGFRHNPEHRPGLAAFDLELPHAANPVQYILNMVRWHRNPTNLDYVVNAPHQLPQPKTFRGFAKRSNIARTITKKRHHPVGKRSNNELACASSRAARKFRAELDIDDFRPCNRIEHLHVILNGIDLIGDHPCLSEPVAIHHPATEHTADHLALGRAEYFAGKFEHLERAATVRSDALGLEMQRHLVKRRRVAVNQERFDCQIRCQAASSSAGANVENVKMKRLLARHFICSRMRSLIGIGSPRSAARCNSERKAPAPMRALAWRVTAEHQSAPR